jgi:prolyl-tRNA synthetase
MRRDALRADGKISSESLAREAFVGGAPALLEAIQDGLRAAAQARLDGNVRTDVTTYDALAAYFGDDEDSPEFRGWVRAGWRKAEGAALADIEAKLKALKLTVRNAPLAQPDAHGACIFTGAPADQTILIARAY